MTRLKIVGTPKEQSLPSLVALGEDKKTILGIGEEAQELMGKVGSQFHISQPIREGVLRESSAGTVFLRYIFQQHLKYSWIFKPTVLVSVATDATAVEREALRDVLERVGSREVYLVDQTLAGAIGAGLPVGQSSGNVVISLGAGIIEMSVISLGTSIGSKSLRWGGQYLDEVIKKSIRTRAQVDISGHTAEFLKTHVSSFTQANPKHQISIKGRSIITGKPTEIQLTAADLIEVLQPVIDELVTALREFLEDITAEVATDVIDKGIIITGGLAQLGGLVELLTESLGVPVTVAENPETSTIRGLEVIAQHLDLYQRSLAYTKGNE